MLGMNAYIFRLRSMIQTGRHVFSAVEAPKYAHVGSPETLQQFLINLRIGKFQTNKKLRIAFDLSGTLRSTRRGHVASHT